MRIGIDVTETSKAQRTGAAHFVVNLVEALLAHNSVASQVHEFKFYYRLSRHQVRAPRYIPQGHAGRWYWGPFGRPHNSQLDIIHGFQNRVPTWRGTAKVLTLFDIMPALESAPQWMSTHFIEKRKKQFAALSMNCDAILCISETTKKDFMRLFAFPAERIHITYPGVTARFSPQAREGWQRVASRYHVPERYMLFTGESSPRKNISRLITAYSRSSVRKDTALVIAGSVDPATMQAIADCRRTVPGAAICVPGYVADEDLPALYAGAQAFLFPSLYEGFGLPIIEAMASGVPVLIGDQGASPEVAAQQAVVVDPYQVESIVDGIERVVRVPQAQRDAARAHAQTFSWERCAQQTLAAYDWADQHRRQP